MRLRCFFSNLLIASVILLAGCFFILASKVSAQSAEESGLGIKVSPVRFEIVANPGEKIEKILKISNISQQPFVLYPYLKDFKAGGEGGEPELIVPGTEDGAFLASWIRVSNDGVALNPGEEKEVHFSIEVPKETGPGGYYGAVIFGTTPPDIRIKGEEKGAAVSISQQIGSLVLLQIAGEVDERAILRDFNTDKQFYGVPFAAKFLTRLENLGNVHIKPRGTIEISNMLGKKIAMVRVNDKGGNILPKSIRRFEEIWENGDFAFGRYKAILALSYGTPPEQGGAGKQTVTATTVFWVLPWKLIVPILCGLIFIIALIIFIVKFYKNKAVKRVLKEAGLSERQFSVKRKRGKSLAFRFGIALVIFLIFIFLFGLASYFVFFA